MHRKLKKFLFSACVLICLELFIFDVIGDEPIPVGKYPFVRVNEPSFYNNGFEQTIKKMDTQNVTSPTHVHAQLPTAQPPEVICADDRLAKANYFRMKTLQVNSLAFDILIDSEPCQTDTYLFIVIHSLHNNTEKRHLIRETWGSITSGKKWPGYEGVLPPIQLIFLFGVHKNNAFNALVQDESKLHKDVVQYDFGEDYRNMTLKNLMGIQWVSTHCTHTKYILKADDDIFANIPSIITMLEKNEFVRTIIGPYNPKSHAVRDVTSKWFLTCSEYPFAFLPPYMSGSAYILTQDLISDLYITSYFVPLIHIDDLYVTGILGKILHAEYAYSAGGFIYAGRSPATAFNLAREDVYTRAMPEAADARALWEELVTFKPPSRLRAETLILMFFSVVFVGFCLAFMCVLEMDDDVYRYADERHTSLIRQRNVNRSSDVIRMTYAKLS